MLTVASHHREYRSHNSLTIHNSKVVARNIPALPEQKLLAHASGTRVTVRDLFGSMPVRVRQRSIEAERLGSAKNFDQLLLSIVALLLSWPDEVALTVREISSPRVVSLSPSQLARQVRHHSISSNVICSRTICILSKAALAEREDADSWVPLGASAPGITVTGCISLRPVATKRVQFISLGVQPLLNENQSNVLYEEVNKVFANSSFGTIEDGVVDDADGPAKTYGFTQKALKVRKGIDRWPMFFLQINLEGLMESLDSDELLDERRGTLAKITSLLQVTIYEFLKKHHFHPKSVHAFQQLKAAQPTTSARPHREHTASVTIASRSKSHRTGRVTRPVSELRKSKPSRATGQAPVSPFASWSRLKLNSDSAKKLKSCSSSISPLLSEAGEEGGDGPGLPEKATNSNAWNPLFSKTGDLLRKPFDDGEDVATSDISAASQRGGSSVPSNGEGSVSSESENIVWVDPATNVRALINPRTGFIVKPGSSTGASSLMRTQSTGSIRERRRRPPLPANTTNSSKNQVFEPTEAAIPSVPQISECFGHEHNDHDWQDLGDINIDGPSGKISRTLQSKISKEELGTAQVIQQVDRKFILVKIFKNLLSHEKDSRKPRDGTHTGGKQFMLVLIDQHAADERCRVEELMEQYFVVNNNGVEARIEPLDKPLRFDLSGQEWHILKRFREHFRHWGIRYELFRNVDVNGRESARVTVEIQTLPSSIAERCRLEPRLLVELLRKELWRLNDRSGVAVGVAGFDGGADGGPYEWAARFHQCPEGIMEMINSSSCRSTLSLLFWPLIRC